MTKFSDIKGFAFDLDGVITDTAKFHTIAWRDLAKQLSIPWNTELEETLKGIDRLGSLEMILQAGGKQAEYSKFEKEAFAAWKNARYVELISTLKPTDILPGMRDFITSLNDNGYLASIASASKNAPFILERLGLIDQFVGIVNPATLKAGKPNPEIFVRAAEILNLPPKQVLGLEDAAAGIAAINGANEISLGIGSITELNDADLLMSTTEEVTLENIAAQMDA